MTEFEVSPSPAVDITVNRNPRCNELDEINESSREDQLAISDICNFCIPDNETEKEYEKNQENDDKQSKVPILDFNILNSKSSTPSCSISTDPMSPLLVTAINSKKLAQRDKPDENSPMNNNDDYNQLKRNNNELNSTNGSFTAKSVQNMSKSRQQELVIDPTYLEELYNNLLQRKEIPSDEYRKPLLSLLRSRMMKYIIEEDYDKAQELKEAEDLLQSASTLVSDNVTMTVEERINATKNNIATIEDSWRNKLLNFEKEKINRLNELEKTHKRELVALEQHCSSQEFLVNFDKPSGSLLHIRKLQKIRALSKDFIGAKALKKQADELQLKESEEAKQRAIQRMKVLYGNLMQKQERELFCAKQKLLRQKTELELERDDELKPLKSLLTQLENNSHGPLKYFNPTKSRSFVPLASATTPRTRKKVAEYKRSVSGQRLNLNGIDVTKYIRPNTAVRRLKTSTSHSHFECN